MSRRQPKVFDPAIFQNAGEVWASSPHLRSKSDFQIKLQQKSRRKSKESQLPFQSREAAMRIQGFRGNCDSQASWGCAPALPNQIQVVFLGELLLGIPIFSVRQKGVPPLLLPATCFRLPTILSPYITKNRHRNFFRFHDGFSSTLSLLLIHIEETEPSRISCKMFIQRRPI